MNNTLKTYFVLRQTVAFCEVNLNSEIKQQLEDELVDWLSENRPGVLGWLV